MRKYLQLALVVTAIASLSLMLLYERKYSKMKMILELLNGFHSKETAVKTHSPLQTTHEPYLTYSPSWTHLTDTLYLYSAYWQNKSDEQIILVLATSVLTVNSDDLNCYVWHEGYTKAMVGKVKVEKYTRDSSDFFISCSHLGARVVPYGIIISYKSANSSFLPVTTFVKTFKMAACLQILPTAFHDTLLLAEFLIFHRHVGIDNFIIYENGLSPSVRKFLEHAKYLEYRIDILHWNYPVGKLGESAQSLDCFARSFLLYRVNSVATVRLGQFLVPKRPRNLTDVIGMTDDVNSYKLNTRYFCSEYSVDIIAETLNFPFISLRYTKHLKKLEESSALIHRNDIWNYRGNSENTKLIPASDMMLYTYGSCNQLPQQFHTKYGEDITMTQYKNAFFMSPLYHYIENELKILSSN